MAVFSSFMENANIIVYVAIALVWVIGSTKVRSMKLWEILVPCKYQDNEKPVSTKHHKQFDQYVKTITHGLTVMRPVKGLWVDKGITYEDRVIPVRIACSDDAILKIAKFALTHYRQISVMYYELSNNVNFVTEA